MSVTQATRSTLLTTSGPRFRAKGMPRRFTKSGASRSSLAEPGLAPFQAPTEWHSIQRAIAGDYSALDHLFSAYTARLRRTAFAILRNWEDAEDAVQNGLSNAYIKLGHFRGQSSFSTWLTRIVINSALMIRRKRDRRPETSLDEILDNMPEKTPHEIVHMAPNPEQIHGKTEMHALVEQEIRALSPGLRVAFQLCEFDGLSTEHTMQTLGIRKQAFKSRISRARKKIAKGMQRALKMPCASLRAHAPKMAQTLSPANIPSTPTTAR